MHYRKTIAVFGFNDLELEMIIREIPVSDAEVLKVECATDLIAIDHLALIISLEVLSVDEWDMIIQFYTEIGSFSETVVIIGAGELPRGLNEKFKHYPNFEKLIANLKYIVLTAYKRKKKNENFSKSIANAITILSLIRSKPGVTTKEISEKIELSERTILRYIETLKAAGEWIEYDPSLKGWKLGCEKSLLMNEI